MTKSSGAKFRVLSASFLTQDVNARSYSDGHKASEIR